MGFPNLRLFTAPDDITLDRLHGVIQKPSRMRIQIDPQSFPWQKCGPVAFSNAALDAEKVSGSRVMP
jgi:hypothetical protein